MVEAVPNAVLKTPLRSRLAPHTTEIALLVSVFVVAACGLLYELAAGAIASYLLGDSILQFSTIIGAYLFAMGVGSWLSRYLERQLTAQFLRIELLVALFGGLMPAGLFAVNAYAPQGFRFILYAWVMLLGILVGLEIPLVMRILKRHTQLKDLVSQVLTFDYLGALAVSVAFPLLLVPNLGLIRTGVLFGLMNAVVAVWAMWLFRFELRAKLAHGMAAGLTLLVLLTTWLGADTVTTLTEDKFYQDPVLFTATSPYQKIVVTHGRQGHRLFLNGNLQFAQRDEYRYHEALVHPVMAAHGKPKRVAILGGGDGMAVREVLKYPSVESITLVELDPAMTQLFKHNPALSALNKHSLNSPKLTIVNQDAFRFLDSAAQNTDAAHTTQTALKAPEKTHDMYDIIIVDFPDPSNYAIGKLYTTSFYALLEAHLSASGYAVIQTTSPLIARESFWTVASTVEAVGLTAAPYHAHVPSFGEWGYIIASHRPFKLPDAGSLPSGLQFLSEANMPALFDFPKDMAKPATALPANRLSNQVLVSTFEREWGKVGH
jgi:spermidine synthase